MNSNLAVKLAFSMCFTAVFHSVALGENFTNSEREAVKYGVHEVELHGDGNVPNPFDTSVQVTFTPASGSSQARRVDAFYDGRNTWRARVYVSEPGTWSWRSTCSTDLQLDGRSGQFSAVESTLRGRFLPHPENPRHWITEDRRWFLNLNDTAYFLLCRQDGNGTPVTDDDARRYLSDDVARGITSVRCFLASHQSGFQESPEQWQEWFFQDDTYELLRMDNLQCADRRLQQMLNHHPDMKVQLILFPTERYGRDGQFWSALSPTQRERLMRHLIARYAAFPQLFWLFVNDAHYGPKFPNNNQLAREAGEYFREHDLWQHPRSTGHARRIPFQFASEAWVDYIHIEHAHDLGAQQYDQYDEMAKPVFLGEDRYEQDHGPAQDPADMRYWQRRLFWSWLLTGGTTNYGGRWWAVHPYSETGSKPATFHKRPKVTFRSALVGLDSVQAIQDFFRDRAIDLGQFTPDHSLVVDVPGRNGSLSPKLMHRLGEEFLVYHPNTSTEGQATQPLDAHAAQLRLDMRKIEGEFTVEWFRPEDGLSQLAGKVTAGDWLELTSPWPGTDVVLRLTR